MGNSRFVLAINGILMISLGGAFWFYPEFFSKLMFPNILDNDSAERGYCFAKKHGGWMRLHRRNYVHVPE